MKLFVVRDSAFGQRNGEPVSEILSYDKYAKRFLGTFEHVEIVGRMFSHPIENAKPVTGDRVTFMPFPGFRGPVGLLANFWRVGFLAARSVKRGNAYILRIPSTIPTFFFLVLILRRIPFAVEVCADPEDAYSRKALNGSKLAPFFRACFSQLTRWQCRAASITCYVTQSALQRKYPPASGRPTYSFTSIDLVEEHYSSGPKNYEYTPCPHIVLTGNMQKTIKGHDVLINAMKIAKDLGQPTRLTVIGHGENQVHYAALASQLGVDVQFAGRLENGRAISEVLDRADLFVLPSRQEGLPRALLEAMARGLPAIATDVGGTGELLPPEAMVPSDDSLSMAEKIVEFLRDRNLMNAQASRNHAVALEYREELTRLKRDRFFKELKALSEAAG